VELIWINGKAVHQISKGHPHSKTNKAWQKLNLLMLNGGNVKI